MKITVTQVQINKFHELTKDIPFKAFPYLWVSGITLAPVVVILKAKFADNVFLRNHEAIHWWQVQRDGFFKFYLKYMYEWVAKWGYKNISYEVEARENETNLEYLQDKLNKK